MTESFPPTTPSPSAPVYQENLAAAAALDPRTEAFIDGAFVPGKQNRTFDTVSPRDGRVLAAVAECDESDVDIAVGAARAAFEDGRWAGQSPQQRRKVLARLAALIDEHRHELALLETLDMGKPISESLSVDLRVTVQTFDFYAEAVDKTYDEVAPTDHRTLATITREPVGVVAAIVPWNFPLMMASWKLGPALAAGNSVVLKPAEQSPLSALRLAELAAAAGLPDGVLNVVPGDGPTTGAALGRHPCVDAVTFTGSGEVGRLFLHYAAESNLKQVSLELGGKSPQIVLQDAPDTATVAEAVATGVYFNQGEMCTAGSRLVVHRSRKDELLDALIGLSADRAPGDPLDPATTMGALVEHAHLRRVLGHIQAGEAEGATVVTGGRQTRAETGGWYVEPTILDDITPEMSVAQEEIFGPVLSVLTFDEVEEAVRIANGTRYGLGAAVWTNDLASAHLTARAIRAGTVWVNCYDASDYTVPFGGYGESGFGRDRSLHALDKYTQLKTTWINLGGG